MVMGLNRWLINILALLLIVPCGLLSHAQQRRSILSTISGGVVVSPSAAIASDSVSHELVMVADSISPDSLRAMAAELLDVDPNAIDSLSAIAAMGTGAASEELLVPSPVVVKQEDDKQRRERKPGALFSDSVSVSKMAWTAAVLPGYGQIYNKQYYKLPIIYGAMGLSTALFIQENKRYQPLKKEYDELTLTDLNRSEYLDELQAKMIRSNTRRQFYIGGMAASYVYSLMDATLKYSTNEVSSVKKATTLAMICPGAGQIYNKSYWKVPFVVGGFATMIYVIDWNNRGYTRFKKAYALRYDYDENPDDYPDGSLDEFTGRYSASYLKSIRNSYRRNRDLCLIMTAGLYILQVIDAHVDAHLKDYDISDDLTMNIEPMLQTGYSPVKRSNFATYGFNLNLTF